MFNDSPVNWSTWRQFNGIEKNHTYRKEVFDEFIAKTKYIAPIVENRFSLMKQVYKEYESRIDNGGKNKLDPLSAYLENENISYNYLVEFVKSMGDRAKNHLRRH